MSSSSCDDARVARSFSPSITPTPTPACADRDRDSPPAMHLFREHREHRIQRWISDPLDADASPTPDADEQRAREAHDYYADLDWELEEFEREIALRFVMHRDLWEGQPRIAEPRRPSCMARSPSSTSTLHALTPVPPTPRAPTSPATATSTSTSTSTPPTTPPSRPTSLISSILRPPHKHASSPSVVSLPASHFSACTTSSGALPSTSTSTSARSFASRIRAAVPVLVPPVPSPKPATCEVGAGAAARKKRRVSVPVLAPKRRRLIVRGVGRDDEYAVEGVRRWAASLGEVSRISRGRDGAMWIEFRDRRVADNVCCLQAQVQIPQVGRVVLDWAEGRHPG